MLALEHLSHFKDLFFGKKTQSLKLGEIINRKLKVDYDWDYQRCEFYNDNGTEAIENNLACFGHTKESGTRLVNKLKKAFGESDDIYLERVENEGYAVILGQKFLSKVKPPNDFPSKLTSWLDFSTWNEEKLIINNAGEPTAEYKTISTDIMPAELAELLFEKLEAERSRQRLDRYEYKLIKFTNGAKIFRLPSELPNGATELGAETILNKPAIINEVKEISPNISAPPVIKPKRSIFKTGLMHALSALAGAALTYIALKKEAVSKIEPTLEEPPAINLIKSDSATNVSYSDNYIVPPASPTPLNNKVSQNKEPLNPINAENPKVKPTVDTGNSAIKPDSQTKNEAKEASKLNEPKNIPTRIALKDAKPTSNPDSKPSGQTINTVPKVTKSNQPPTRIPLENAKPTATKNLKPTESAGGISIKEPKKSVESITQEIQSLMNEIDIKAEIAAKNSGKMKETGGAFEEILDDIKNGNGVLRSSAGKSLNYATSEFRADNLTLRTGTYDNGERLSWAGANYRLGDKLNNVAVSIGMDTSQSAAGGFANFSLKADQDIGPLRLQGSLAAAVSELNTQLEMDTLNHLDILRGEIHDGYEAGLMIGPSRPFYNPETGVKTSVQLISMLRATDEDSWEFERAGMLINNRMVLRANPMRTEDLYWNNELEAGVNRMLSENYGLRFSTELEGRFGYLFYATGLNAWADEENQKLGWSAIISKSFGPKKGASWFIGYSNDDALWPEPAGKESEDLRIKGFQGGIKVNF